MYSYTTIDQEIVDQRVDEFRDQVDRYGRGDISDEEFLHLRLRNGLYHQRHAYMLRVAIPYGVVSSTQLRGLADIADRYDRGYAHFTTRQNVQFNWLELNDVPDLLADLSKVQMHAIQTSGNCVRNVTTDAYAGVAHDEVEDPRPYAEALRQWSTLHPEFGWLPRKFKIAITGADADRAAIAVHDIGLRIVRNDHGETGFSVSVGGGLGRTPLLAKVIRPFLPREELLAYVEAILRVYNLEGDRENKRKARIKINVRRDGAERFAAKVEEAFARIDEPALRLDDELLAELRARFIPPAYETELDDSDPTSGPAFAAWAGRSVDAHRMPGYRTVTVSLKSPSRAPGDTTSEQMRVLAAVADDYSFGELRVTHEQNLVLPHVRALDLVALFGRLDEVELATPNAGLLTDLICCPGLDFCNLASASSLSVAQDIQDRLAGTEKLVAIGEVKLKMSGCVNACGHHHVGDIGVLGVEKEGEEHFQLMLGGSAGDDARLARWLGPAVPKRDVAAAIERLGDAYLEVRTDGEAFHETLVRIGPKPFHEAVYSHRENEQ